MDPWPHLQKRSEGLVVYQMSLRVKSWKFPPRFVGLFPVPKVINPVVNVLYYSLSFTSCHSTPVLFQVLLMQPLCVSLLCDYLPLLVLHLCVIVSQPLEYFVSVFRSPVRISKSFLFSFTSKLKCVSLSSFIANIFLYVICFKHMRLIFPEHLVTCATSFQFSVTLLI